MHRQINTWIRLLPVALCIPLILVSCSNSADQLYGDLPRYENADPHLDIKRAIRANDLRFIALRGYSVYVPGIAYKEKEYGKYGLNVIAGSSDDIGNYEHGRLIAIARYYAATYNRLLSTHIRKLEALQMAESIPGYKQFLQKFNLESVTIGDINMLPFSFHPILNTKQDACIDTIWWFNPIENDKPRHTWTELEQAYNKANRVVCSHKWLQAWINAGNQRTLQIGIFGTRPHTEEMLDTLVLPAWKQAGLKGKPYYEINFRQHDRWLGKIFLNETENSGLIVSLSTKQGQHWLDGRNFSYHPTSPVPEYIVVTRDGVWTKHGHRIKKKTGSN